MILETIVQAMIKEAVKANDTIARDILRLVVGQIQLDSSSKDLNEDQKLTIVKKIIKSNETTIEAMHSKPLNDWSPEWQHQAPKLGLEIATLQKLLPKTWSEEETKNALVNCITDIKAAKSDGQALGVSMKYLKSISAAIDNNIVKKVVEELRK